MKKTIFAANNKKTKMMKKLLFLFVAVSALFVSCDKESNDDSPKSSDLIGKWEVKSFKADVTLDGVPLPAEDSEFDNIVGTIFEFNSNSKVKITTYEEFGENDGAWTTDESTYVYNESKKEIVITSVDEFDGSLDIIVLNVKLLSNTNFNFNITDVEEDEDGVFKSSLDIKCERKK